MTEGGDKNWVRNLPAVLLAEHMTVHGLTGKTPFLMEYGREAILLIELKHLTWRVLDWGNVTSRGDLLAVRAHQLELRDADLDKVALRKRRKQEEGKEAFDDSRRIQGTQLDVGDMVLKHDAKKEQDMSSWNKLAYHWLGPYRICAAMMEKSTYVLEELDGTRLLGTHAGNRLKKFVKHEGFYELAEDEGNEDVDMEDGDARVRDFEIRLPTLTAAQWKEYAQYEEEDDEGNVL